MTTQEKKAKLIETFHSRQLTALFNYRKKITAMNSTQVEQEYSIVILDKEYKPPKKKEAVKKVDKKVKEDKSDLSEW